MKQENLLNCDGCRFSATIKDVHVTGKITIEDNNVYLCQDKYNGNHNVDLKGYMYAWAIWGGSDKELEESRVKYFKLLPLATEEIEAHKDWRVGDIISLENYDDREIIFRNGELVVCKTLKMDTATENYTCNQLYRYGWRLKMDEDEDEELVTELTLDEIKEKLNITGELKIIE
jgi:hypothetical protein